uniref:Thioredoxin domain-containing protein n=1 Tax=Setaria italica TaxID=4555 RepID=K3XMT3_SETIT
MSESFLDRMVSQLRSTCKFYTGYPKDLGPSRIIPFTSERQFVQLLHEGRPVVVAFTIKCTYTQHLDKVLEEAAATFYPHIKFVRVECPKYPGFCLTRQKNEYPFVEVFYNPEQVIIIYFMYIGSNVSVSSFWFFIAISIPALVIISHFFYLFLSNS